MSRVLSLAGFQVTLIGRFWVIPEDHAAGRFSRRYDSLRFGSGREPSIYSLCHTPVPPHVRPTAVIF